MDGHHLSYNKKNWKKEKKKNEKKKPGRLVLIARQLKYKKIRAGRQSTGYSVALY